MLPLRRCASAIIINPVGKVLLGERIHVAGSWQLPQGGFDSDTDVRVAALREAYEELGINTKLLVHLCDLEGSFEYLFPSTMHTPITKAFRGQALEFSLFFLNELGDPALVCDLRGMDGTKPEFSHVKWGSLEEAVEGIVEFKKPAYEAMYKVAKPLIDKFVSEAK
eukprot:comp14386_c0_seq1/m.20725 comp14386_c0_seq1/g.20725  ORF comp14386_c0_seq1/g.20725 comp14386_c0_seq1/m.20725 type:complete len:166 (-) comp14386_c0_seq1:10-507(-)